MVRGHGVKVRGALKRPNANPILDMMRDSDWDDPWGTAIAWAFSACDVLYDADPNAIPAGLEYRPGMGGPEVPGAVEDVEDLSWETCQVWEWLHATSVETDPIDLPYWEDAGFRARAAELRFALLCLDRYLDWLKAAGKDY